MIIFLTKKIFQIKENKTSILIMDTSKNNIGSLIILFIISPFLSLLTALKLNNVRPVSNIIWAYFTFLGYILVASDIGTDAFRYFNWFESFARSSPKGKLNFFKDDLGVDLFKKLSFYVVSIFSNSGRVYFAFIGFVFGFFYSRIFEIILNNIPKKTSFLDKLFVFSFTFIIPITAVQFVRSSTASVLFVYFILKYFFEGNSKKYLVFACLGSVFIHFSFILPALVLILFLFVSKKMDIYIIAFILTSFFTFFEFSALETIIRANLPLALESKQVYLNSDYAESELITANKANWYIQLKPYSLKIATIFLILYTRSLLMKNKLLYEKYKSPLIFGLFLGSIVNVLSLIPSLSRFLTLSNSIMWVVFIFFHTNNKKYKANWFTSSTLTLFFVFQSIISFRYIADLAPIEFLVGNPLSILIGVTDIPIIDYLK